MPNLKKIALSYAKKIYLNPDFTDNSSGKVAVALLTDKGNIYTGVNLEMNCDLGFCAEMAAIADMLKAKETRIIELIAITEKGKIIPPCGRCREAIYQVNAKNIDTLIYLSATKKVPLKELLPNLWTDTLYPTHKKI